MFRQLIGQVKIWKNKKLKLLGEEIDEYAASLAGKAGKKFYFSLYY